MHDHKVQSIQRKYGHYWSKNYWSKNYPYRSSLNELGAEYCTSTISEPVANTYSNCYEEYNDVNSITFKLLLWALKWPPEPIQSEAQMLPMKSMWDSLTLSTLSD